MKKQHLASAPPAKMALYVMNDSAAGRHRSRVDVDPLFGAPIAGPSVHNQFGVRP